MSEAYGAFNNRTEKDEAMLVFFLKSFCKISDALQENDKAIKYAEEVLAHALSDEDKIFAYGKLGSANSRKGEYDKAIANHEKALELGVEHSVPSITKSP